MPRLTDAQKDLARMAGEKMFRWIMTAEHHFAITRLNPNRYAVAYEDYAADAAASPLAFPKTDDDIEAQIRECENVLATKEGSSDFKDHIAISSTCLYLGRLMMHKLSNIGEHVVLEALRVRTEFFSKVNPQPEPEVRDDKLTSDDENGSDVEYDLPLSMPSPSLRWSKVRGCSNRDKVSEDAITRYKRNPDRLQGKVFLSIKAHDDDEDEAFRVHAILMANEQRLFYLTFAGEGAEAVGYGSEGFFKLLEGSMLVNLPKPRQL